MIRRRQENAERLEWTFCPSRERTRISTNRLGNSNITSKTGNARCVVEATGHVLWVSQKKRLVAAPSVATVERVTPDQGRGEEKTAGPQPRWLRRDSRLVITGRGKEI